MVVVVKYCQHCAATLILIDVRARAFKLPESLAAKLLGGLLLPPEMRCVELQESKAYRMIPEILRPPLSCYSWRTERWSVAKRAG